MAKLLLSPIEQYVVDVVRSKRQEKGWSQKDLAYELNLSIGYIGDIENPKQRAKFNLDHINELAKIFECSPKDFLPEKPL
jgi:transcriptional regulator with XRE-family HTH domain